MKHDATKRRLKNLYDNKYYAQKYICDLNVTCINLDQDCSECVLCSKQSTEEFNRITENKSKLVTIEEVQEAINILVILG
ncbi:MAG: hypothetical protein GY829_14820 [Gammaproteobacteria bacterium]|nr:hypothetical protein [Gammaproteobacteria bacterium]